MTQNLVSALIGILVIAVGLWVGGLLGWIVIVIGIVVVVLAAIRSVP